MLAVVSTRRYPIALELVGEQVEKDATLTSKSAVSRKFVAMTEHALTALLGQDLSGLDLVAVMIDDVHFADRLCIVALGIDIDGTKHPLALVEGSTGNTTLVPACWSGCATSGSQFGSVEVVAVSRGRRWTASHRQSQGKIGSGNVPVLGC